MTPKYTKVDSSPMTPKNFVTIRCRANPNTSPDSPSDGESGEGFGLALHLIVTNSVRNMCQSLGPKPINNWSGPQHSQNRYTCRPDEPTICCHPLTCVNRTICSHPSESPLLMECWLIHPHHQIRLITEEMGSCSHPMKFSTV